VYNKPVNTAHSPLGYRVLFTTLLLTVACSGDFAGLGRACTTNCPIVFAKRTNFIWDLYTINADGTNLQNVTRDTATDVYPAWSPDHRHVAFYSGREPAGIYIMDADGSHRHFVVAQAPSGHMSWSPDGRQIALDGSSDFGGDIFVMNADGTGYHDITNSNDFEEKPAWSPNGDLVAYSHYHEIWVMNPDGTNRHSLTGWQPQPAFDPAWSPDGSHIAFASIDSLGITNLFTMTADGRNWQRLTITDRPADRIPNWSPDGTQIVFQRDFSDSVGVFVVDAQGARQPRQIAWGLSGQAAW